MQSSAGQIAVIGAGIGGLTAAIALCDAGFRVTVYEQSSILTEIGAGIGVAPDPNRRCDAVGELRADPDDLVGEAAGLRDHAEGAFAVELAGDEIVKRAAYHAQPAFAR